ncbi:MAG: TonB-dependent receptor [Balneolales bacterium]|nr:TonB-dependent receptor [Balneolales bacterium]
MIAFIFGNELVTAGTTGKIVGTITDAETGEPLPGVNVAIIGTQQGAITDLEGYYVILNVTPGEYELRASFLGFGTQIIQQVRVRINQTTTIDFSLSETVIEGQEITVVAERPIIQRDLTSSKATISSRDIELLPVENFNEVVNLQAGVVNGHFRGGRLGEVAYLVDGIPINDSFDNSFAYQVENNAIQEVEVISGTFNAEFGQAQSGVVNIVTKDGGTSYEGNFSAYTGDYLTTRTGDFQNTNQINPADIYDIQGSLSGPVPGMKQKLNFFISGRRIYDEGYLYGREIVRPLGQSDEEGEFVQIDGRTVYVPQLGDSSYQAMGWSEQNTIQLKLSTPHIRGNKLSLTALYQSDMGQNYTHLYQYNPDGIPTNYGESITFNLVNNYTFSAKTFMNVRAAYFINGSKSYVYEDPLDTRYPRDDARNFLGGNFSFYRGGTVMDYVDRETRTLVSGLDVTSQVNREHMIKTGIQLKLHQIEFREFEIQNNSSTGFQPAIPPQGTPDHVYYNELPIEISAYAQDKLEFEDLIVNIGLRFDYFDANSEIPSDYTRPTTSERVKTDPNWQLSPRFGLAYPITETGVVHVSYGHFFQIPAFQYLYTNPDFTYDPESGLGRVFGNPNLKPQQTISYEIGLQQGFNDILSVKLTAFYKNIRNLLGTRIETITPGGEEPFPLSRYGRFINTDYGQTKGLVLDIERRMTNNFSLNINYAYQIAMGNASDPQARLLDEQAGVETEKQLVPLDWDRRHQLNTTFSLLTQTDWVLTVLGSLGSGFPYTPSRANERIGIENSDRKPMFLNFDLYASKGFVVAGQNASFFARVFNVLDLQNEIQVYTDTGRAFPNLRFQTGEPQGLNTKEEFLFRPDYYSAPRRLSIGFTISF